MTSHYKKSVITSWKKYFNYIYATLMLYWWTFPKKENKSKWKKEGAVQMNKNQKKIISVASEEPKTQNIKKKSGRSDLWSPQANLLIQGNVTNSILICKG